MLIKLFCEKKDILGSLDAFDSLPEVIAPKYFSENESSSNEIGKLWSDKNLLKSFIIKNKLGFNAWSNESSFDFDFPSKGYSSVLIELKSHSFTGSQIDKLLMTLLKTSPLFGFCCTWEEYKHRNQVSKTIGKNTIKSFVGLNLEKNIPGLYYKTILSKQLLLSLDVSINEIKKYEFIKVAECKNQYIISCFDDMFEWAHYAQDIDKLCNITEGFFVKSDVESSINDCQSAMQVVSLLKKWK